MKNCRGWVLLPLGIIIVGCAVHTPEVTFTSERTALEKQILGSYRLIEEDTWELSSVRGARRNSKTAPADRLEAIEAVASRLFNADDIEDFKRDEVVGENAGGFLIIRQTPKLQEDAEYQALVERIATEENSDRRVIIRHLLEQNRKIGANDSLSVYQIFARMVLETSPAGTWVQKADSSWTRK